MFKFNKIYLLLMAFVILMIVPAAFALDNQTNASVEIRDDAPLASAEIYVNSSNTEPGNGLIDNPYNNIPSGGIEKDTIVHLSDGEYTYKSFRSLNNVTFIGQSMNNTVIKCNGFEITSNNIILKNLTIVGATFKNQADFTAENVVFKNGVGHELDEYGNSYGGSIYTSYRQDDEELHIISLTNCYFTDNTAEYGGAIYIDHGNLEINKCYFINNHAYNYGGAICGVGANKITIKKSKFINDFSINDCGGAIYVQTTALTMDDVEANNCSATFGSVVTALNVKLDINNLNAYSNTAKYDGGAIYQMYGTSLISASNFILNHANNGGALFLDNVTALLLISNKFINNTADICAGAFYSISNKQYQNTGNIFNGNHALVNDDIYNITTIDPIMKAFNYTAFKGVFGDDYVILPSYYNLVDDGYVTSVKDQHDSGNCWSFAVLAALESCILKSTNLTYDLSEENMKNLMASFSDYGWQVDVNEGGYDDMGIGYLVGWLGPVLESEDLFDDKSTLSPLLNPKFHIQDVVYLKRNSYLDNDAIKQAILKYGAVATGIYYSGLYLINNSYYYYDTIMPANHAVTIVGWDDSYSRYNFNRIPQGDGAFIVKNSWGTDWGKDGYFYVSYYDTKFAEVGKAEVSYTFVLNDTIKYDKNYQYDISGKTDYLITGEDRIWYQNIFTATDNEYLAAVSTYFNAVTNWNVSVYVNGVFKLTKSGKSSAGYHTINLGDLISLSEGDTFKVVFKLDCNGYANVPIVEARYMNKVPFSSGISYFSRDGENWIDLFNYTHSDFNHRYLSQIACIKAFTIFNTLNSTIKLSISNKGVNSANINAIVKDQYGNLINSGKVIFTIDGIDYESNVTNGVANLFCVFNNSVNTISARFNGENYNSSDDRVSVEFFNPIMKIDIKDIQYGDKLKVNITLLDSEKNFLEDNVTVNVSNQSFIVHVKGKTSFTLPINLDIGQHNINFKCESLTRDVLVNISKVNVNLDVVFDEKRENLTIKLIFSKSINEMVNISISGKNYVVNTTYGRASLFLDDLDYGDYDINISFTNKNYNNIYKNYTIHRNVYKSKLTFVELKYLDDGLIYVAKLSKLNNDSISGVNVTLFLNNQNFENITDINGNVAFKFNLINGYYPIKLIFNGFEDIVKCDLIDTLNVSRNQVIIQNISYSGEIKVFDNEYLSVIFSDNANGNLSIYIDAKEYFNNYFNSNQLNISLSNLTVGIHKINVTYSGIEGYRYSNQFDISVIKTDLKVNITYDGLYVGKIATITFNLADVKGYIFVDIEDKNYYAPINNGKAIFTIEDLSFGEKLLRYSYNGDSNHLPTNGTCTFKVNYANSLVGNKDISMSYSQDVSYRVRVLGINSEAVTGGNVVIVMAGKSYKASIGKDGWVSFKINLKPATYVITAEYNGVKVSNKIIVNSILKLNNYKIKKSAKKVVIKATLGKINGKYLKGKTITFKFQSKKYTAKTNKNGVAKITLKKNVIKKLKFNKKYSIQANYLKDTINRSIYVKK